MPYTNLKPKFGKFPAMALAAIAVASLTPAHALSEATERKMDKTISSLEKSRISVGAGSMAYIAQESPATGLSLDARVEVPVSPAVSVEGAATTAFSQSVSESGTTIPMLLDGSLKMRTLNTQTIDIYGAAGMSYGVYFGTQRLEDGATFGVPLSVGVDVQAEKLAFSPRFTYRPVFGDQLGGEKVNADSWTAMLDVQLPFL